MTVVTATRAETEALSYRRHVSLAKSAKHIAHPERSGKNGLPRFFNSEGAPEKASS